MTPERLAEIEARERAATPGPWKGDPEPHAIYIYGADGDMVADTDVPGKYNAEPDNMRTEPDFEDGQRGGVDALLRLRGVGASIKRPRGSLEANYRFMIHARQDVPDLCAELRATQDKLTAARAEIERLMDKLHTIGEMFTGPEGIDDSVRGILACPYDEPFHFHGDGCPACDQVE